MKKLFKIISANIIILTSSVGLFACSPPNFGEIWIITDGGDINDKAFNQQVLEGSQQFAQTFNNNRERISGFEGFSYWKNHTARVKTIISKDGQFSTLQTNYQIAGYAGAKTIIGSGFGHIAALNLKTQELFKSLGIRFILVDGLPSDLSDVAGLTYSSDQSGFLAGLAGAIWLMANHEQYDKNGLKMSTFGGLPADTVVRYMFGYYWGVEYFNEYKDSDPEILPMINALRKTAMSKEDLAKKNITFDKLRDSFTGSFASGVPKAQAITSTLINDNKDSVVLPVAGGQTTDLISAISKSSVNQYSKAIGVDVDQSVQYEQSKDLFITSALKGIKQSVNWMLWHSLDLQQDKQNPNDIKPDPEGKDYFNGKKPYLPLSGADYTGIANNPAISPIYDTLTSTDTTSKKTNYWDLAKQVTAAFDKLYEFVDKQTAADKWSVAWWNNVNIKDENKSYWPSFHKK